MNKPIYARRQPSRGPLPTLRGHAMASSSDEVVTSLLISNLHCSSCVRTIEDALGSLSPRPTSVNVSVVTQAVTVHHLSALFPDAIKGAIAAEGFDIVSTPTGGVGQQPSLAVGISKISPLATSRHARHFEQCALCQQESEQGIVSCSSREKLGEESFLPSLPELTLNAPTAADDLSTNAAERRVKVSQFSSLPAAAGPYHVSLSVGGMTCASCTNTIIQCLSDLPGVSAVAVNLLGNSASASIDTPDRVSSIVSAIEDAGYEAEVISVDKPKSVVVATKPTPVDGPYRLSLSVGGMTCVSCVNTVTALANDIPGVTDVAVNLIGKSTTAIIAREALAQQLVTAIEDAGYEAEVTAMVPLDGVAEPSGPRTVDLRIDGMFCPHCPEKVMALLQPLESMVTVVKPITSFVDPILSVSYVPSPPTFTIRDIVSAISDPPISSSRPFTVTIHHPPTLEERAKVMHKHEQRDLLYRLVFAFIVAIPTFIIGVVYTSLVPRTDHTRMWWMRPIWAGNASRVQWALFFLATPVMFYSAWMYHRRSLKEIWALWRKGSRVPVWKRFVRFGSMNLLVSTGVSVAYFSSIALLILAATDKRSASGDGDSTTYFDSVVFLTMFLLMGRYLEAYSKGHTADAISALGKLRPTTALLLSTYSPTASSHNLTLSTSDDPEKGGAEPTHIGAVEPARSLTRVSTEMLEAGDIVRVQFGASPPLDGTIVAVLGNAASFDESSLTGESRLVKKEVGQQVFVGTINRGAIVDVRVDAIGGETMLDHIVKVVREGQTRRAPIERVADLLTGYFVPVVTLLAIVTWVIWLALGLGGALPQDYLDISVGGWAVWSLEFAIAVFVVACPCGIGLAAPTALLVGSGLAAKFGILARGGGEAFQEAAQVDLVVFDKTGTLTEGGDPQVTNAEVISSSQKPEVLYGIAAELESASTHPLASAIRSYCAANGATQQAASSLQETPGRGLHSKFDVLDSEAIIGNEAWMHDHGVSFDGRLEALLGTWKSEGQSVVLLAVRPLNAASGFEISAAFAVADPLRTETKAVISALQAKGISTWMVSGDNVVTARAVARKLDIPESNVIAGVLPHEKAEKIEWLQQVGMKREVRGWQRWFGTRRLNARCIVAMIGDGINDAPALSAADVSIAIGSGSDVAISSASFILVSSHLSGVLTLFDLSRTVFNRVKFNFLWASIYNVIALPIAAGVIYPAGHARLAPVWASLAMALSSVSVVCSSLLLKLYRQPSDKAIH